MKQLISNWKLLLVTVIFFILGAVSVLIYQNNISISQADISTNNPTEEVIDYNPKGTGQITPSPTPTEVPVPPDNFSYVLSSPTGKYQILESQPVTADKLQVETGEQVSFSVALKNVGTKNKNLTHICFNHSGGVTFGCILNHLLPAGDEFAFGNSMMFENPGVYSVWITWSQDGSNFYRPVQGKSISIRVE